MYRDKAERIAQALKAVADATRLQLPRLIRATPDGETCVCDIAERLGLRQPTVRHHPKIMTRTRLLHSEKRGTRVCCAVGAGGGRLRGDGPDPGSG
jgi:ArsR family transcriptional regulator